MPDNTDVINSILSDFSNFALVFFGFSISLFTLLYSFVFSRRDNLKDYAEQKKLGNDDPILQQRIASARLFIKKMRGNILNLLITVVIELLGYLLCLWAKYFVAILKEKQFWLLICTGVNAIILVYVLGLLVVVIRDFSRNTKI